LSRFATTAFSCPSAHRFAGCRHLFLAKTAAAIGVCAGEHAFCAITTAFLALALSCFARDLHFSLRDFAVAVCIHFGKALCLLCSAVCPINHAIAIGIGAFEHLRAVSARFFKCHIAIAIGIGSALAAMMVSEGRARSANGKSGG
jgi:ferredoxin